MSVVSRTPVQLDVGVPQMVADGFLCAIARRQGQSGRQYLDQAWGSYPTVGGVPVVPDEKATEIVLHDHRSEP